MITQPAVAVCETTYTMFASAEFRKATNCERMEIGARKDKETLATVTKAAKLRYFG
jgi:hypothetical protein